MKKLQLFGHPLGVAYDKPLELHEAGIATTSKNLRKLAQHFMSVADDMDRMGDDFDHVHLQNKPTGSPDIVITRYVPEYSKGTEIVYDDTLEGHKRAPKIKKSNK